MSRFTFCDCPAGFEAAPERHAPDCPGRSSAVKGPTPLTMPITKQESACADAGEPEVLACIYHGDDHDGKVGLLWRYMPKPDGFSLKFELVDRGHVTRLQAEVERLMSGPPHFCGMPMSLNPHVDAGVPGRFLEVGAVRECIPCLVKSRHDWATKAGALQSELTKAQELLRNAWHVTPAWWAARNAFLSNQPVPADEAQGEPEVRRELFEKWVTGTKHPVFGFLDDRSLARSDDRTGYADEYVQGLWVAFDTFAAEKPAPIELAQSHAEPSHWEDPDGNTITAALKAYNLALGGAPASASSRYAEPLYRRPTAQVQGERQAFEQAFVVQEGVYFSDDHGEYRSMNGRSIEQRDACDLNLRLAGWNARATSSAQLQGRAIPESLRSAMSTIEDEAACMGPEAQGVFTKMRTAVQACFDGTVRPEPAGLYIPDECPHLIVFDDADRENMMFSGAGAREAARKTWERISMSWNAHLFVRIERNSRDDGHPSARAVPFTDSAALRANADRYLWLRDKQTFIWLIQDWFPSDAEFTDVDAVIDAARSKGETP